jgi:hypothetical protein
MPVRFQVSHPERTVIGVASGVVTLKDILAFAHELEVQKALGYKKIIDVMSGQAMVSEVDLAAYGERLRELPREKLPYGPIALVTSSENNAISQLFAKLTGQERPAQVFRSIHDARKWLQQMPTPGWQTSKRPE